MPTVTLTSRNSIKLVAAASAVDDYYVGRLVELTRVDTLGKKTVQRKQITDYVASTKIATIDGLWDLDFHPKVGDTYNILPKDTDGRISTNPAIQALDYITSVTYGRGLNAQKDLKLDTWLDSARVCDSRSDIYVEFLTGAAPTIGDIYILGSAGIWQGEVAQIIGTYIRFTNVIGKLSYKWRDWRTYVVGQLIYEGVNLYEVTSAGVITTQPTHTSGTVGNLTFLSAKDITKVTGAGPVTIALSVGGNPVRFKKNGIGASGYSLYDSDGVNYFRLLGWDVNEQRSVTRHQTNISIDTSLPLFDNMNSLLQHFGGILRYSGDKYVLEVEQLEGAIATDSNEPRNITSDSIIGRISLSDDGIRNAYNSLTASYTEPSNKFEARNVSFFNSEYLKADRNVPKKGSLTIPGITNYYNARMLADKFLTRSRYGLTVTMNIAPKGILLLPGKVVQVQYPRYGWVNKKFRIENLTHNDDCTVDIVANEYDDSFYSISNVSRAPTTAPASTGGNTGMTTLSAPSGLVTTNNTAGNEQISSIDLTWQNASSYDSGSVVTQIYASLSSNLFVEIDSVTGGQTLTTIQNPHGLVVGETIRPTSTQGVLTENTSYYIKSVTANTFTLSLTKNGATLTTLTNTTTNFFMLTATVIAEVPTTTTSYTDSDISNLTGSRVQKYYWLRYKIDEV